MYPNSAKSLVTIVEGTDYIFPATWGGLTTYAVGDFVSKSGTNYVSLTAGNFNNDPTVDTTNWQAVLQFQNLPPIFALLCTANSSGGMGNTVLLAAGDTTPTTIPSSGFVVGQEYGIYLQTAVTLNGVSFVGYR